MNRSFWENEAILNQFRDWLEQTGAELDALEEPAADADGGDEPLPAIGLLQVVEALTAMRHELKLETKSARGLQETVQSVLSGLESAMRRFDAAQAREEEAARAAAAPLVEALVGIDEALLRGARAFTLTHRQMTDSAPRRLRETLEEEFLRLPWWRRAAAGVWHRRMVERTCDALARTNDEEFAGLMQGFELIRARMDRVLEQNGIRRIACVGRRVDPARMTVVELVDDPRAEPETVVEEVRPGYVQGDRVVRFAEVRAVANRKGADWNDTDAAEALDDEEDAALPAYRESED